MHHFGRLLLLHVKSFFPPPPICHAQVIFAALGGIGHLVHMCHSPDRFAQEQAVAALYNLITRQVGAFE